MSIFVNQKALETFNFSGGECQITISHVNIGDKTAILANLTSSDDVMRLLLTVDAIRRINPHSEIDLTIPYFPYARQDRVCNEGEALSVKVMADLINSLNCSCVTVYDPHSDVTPALLNNCRVISLGEIITESFLAKEICAKNITLISPDAGAEKKVHAVAKKLSSSSQSINVICASKIRDTKTGNITSSQIHGNVEHKDVIIIDDICDGGKTFIELSKILKNLGARSICLYVTHGIFSKGLECLKEHFKHVYCLHTLLKPEQIDNSFLTEITIKR